MDLGTLLDKQSARTSTDQRGPCPGRVVSYDRVSQTASVRPVVSPKGRGDEPIIPRVPVLFPGSYLTGISILWDLHEDDEVLLVPCEADISRWHTHAYTGEAPTARAKSLADCVAIPSLTTMPNPYDATAYAAGAIVVRGTDVRLGGSGAVDFVALASLVSQELADIKTYIDAHKHGPGTFSNAGGPVVGMSAAPESAPGVPDPMPAPDPVAATTTKAL
jgi:hypothetical protein